MSAAFVILGYSTYYFQQQRDEWKSYAEKIMTTPIPFKVDHATGDVHFKLPWQWGTEDHATMYGLCKDPNAGRSRSL